MAYLSAADRIEADDLAFILSPRGPSSPAEAITRPLGDATNQFQADYIRGAINAPKAT